MSRVIWDDPKDRRYYTGLDRGVIYAEGTPGVPWNGLIEVEETSSGGSTYEYYFDGRKYLDQSGSEQFEARVKGYTYPDELENATVLDLSYRTLSGDAQSSAAGYSVIHIVYGATLTLDARASSSLEDSDSLEPFSWKLTAKPKKVYGEIRASHLSIDTSVLSEHATEALENILYGDAQSTPRTPTVEELLTLIDSSAVLIITDHGDGTWSADGPDTAITKLTETSFEIDWPSAHYISPEAYTIESL